MVVGAGCWVVVGGTSTWYVDGGWWLVAGRWCWVVGGGWWGFVHRFK